MVQNANADCLEKWLGFCASLGVPRDALEFDLAVMWWWGVSQPVQVFRSEMLK
jgi:hypothetical protein